MASRFKPFLLCVGLSFLASLYIQSPKPLAAQAARKVATTGAAVAPVDRALLDKYCVTCHNQRLKTADLTLDTLDVSKVAINAELLERVVRKLRNGEMPPEGRPRPDEATLETFLKRLEHSLDQAAALSPNPGRVASHRLNRAEYVNAIHDLLALDVDGTELLPSDMAGFGFDNNADVLAITPGLMARYMAAATKISRLAVSSPDNRTVTQMYKVEFGTRQDERMNEDMPLGTHGGMSIRHTFPLDGQYGFAIRLARDGTVSTINGIEENEHEVEVRIDYALVKRFTIGGRFKGQDPGVLIAVPEDDLDGQKMHDYRVNADKELEVRVPVKAGTHLVTVAFTDSLPSPETRGRGRGSSGVGAFGAQSAVDMFYISGPFDGKTASDSPSRQRIFVCHPANSPGRDDEASCARKIVANLARRAYRRTVTDADVQPLVAVYTEGRRARNFDFGIERALEALLSSPGFLLRFEQEPAGKPGTAYKLTDEELASRLSFFLWKSVPDDELLTVAARGTLKQPTVLAQQARRMLADPRGERSVDDFAQQWLQVRNLKAHDVDQQVGTFDPTLREAMARETELFFESQVREDRPVQELLSANYTYLNDRMADHYGIEGVFGSHFRRVTLTDDRRFGLLGQASILTETSYANRTSVVLRGKWVLETLLGAPPPPPPPNVPPLKENVPGAKPAALRERMEQHRASPVCSSCHARMDPLGFALEHFDAIGQWRQSDRGAEINSTIALNGKTIDSPKAFREALLAQGDQYVRTVAEKLLTYALGRGLEYYDAPAVRKLVTDLKSHDYRWSSLILGIVNSEPFQMRSALGVNPTATPAKTGQGQ
jgi:cytochrome c5